MSRFCVEGSLSVSYLTSMALAQFVKHLAAPCCQQIHVLKDFYLMPLLKKEGDWTRVTSELPKLKSNIENLGLRGLMALRLRLRTEVQMWLSLAACSTEMHALIKPLQSREGYLHAYSWLGDVCNLTVFVKREERQTELNRLAEWYGEDFESRLLERIPECFIRRAENSMLEEIRDRLVTESENEDSEASEDF